MKSFDKISIVLLIIIDLCYLTPLHKNAGYLIALAMGVIFFIYAKRKVNVNVMRFLLLYLAIFVLFLLININDLNSRQFHNALLMFIITFFTYYLLSIKDSYSFALKKCPIDLIYILYLPILLFAMYHVLNFAYANRDHWQYRKLAIYQTFPFGWHHVDFSALLILVFLLGIKRHYWMCSVTLAVVSTIIMPSRTWRLFILLFVLCNFFEKQICRMLCVKAFDSFFKQFLWINVATIVFSFFFVYIMPTFMKVVDSHQGLFDTSNMERFSGILYGYQVILNKTQLLFTANVDGLSYAYLTNSTLSMAGRPHNTYISLMISLSMMFTLAFIKCISEIINKADMQRCMPYYLPYALTSIIIHDMFSGIRLLFFLTVLIIPFGYSKRSGN